MVPCHLGRVLGHNRMPMIPGGAQLHNLGSLTPSCHYCKAPLHTRPAVLHLHIRHDVDGVTPEPQNNGRIRYSDAMQHFLQAHRNEQKTCGWTMVSRTLRTRLHSMLHILTHHYYEPQQQRYIVMLST
jgi:hypothetical protein